MTHKEFDGGAVAMICADNDRDGFKGVLVATDGANYRSERKNISEGRFTIFENRQGTFTVKLVLDTRVGSGKPASLGRSPRLSKGFRPG